MAKSNEAVPYFSVDEIVASRGPDFKQIIPKIDPRYFFSNSRFRSLGQVSFPTLIDYLGIYEEGDRWTLTILEATIHDTTRYLFLPLTEGASPDPGYGEFGRPAFGIETNSALYGKRQWQVFDAFADWHFYQKLCNLFLPWKNVPEHHVNAYVNIWESGIGKFSFHPKYELKEPIYLTDEKYFGKVEFEGSDLLIRFHKYNLKIYQTLPTAIDTPALSASPEIAGWIEYRGEKDLELLIGVLYTTKT